MRGFYFVALPLLSSLLACPVAPRPDGLPPSPVTEEEHSRTIDGLRPPHRARPLIVVLALNAGTETTDFLVPWSVLHRAGVAEVVAVAADPGRILLMPALSVDAQETMGDFDARVPEGADYVIVPALHDPTDARVKAWVKAQAARGATIVGVCSGAQAVGEAGLLDERFATGHWADVELLRRAHPSMKWVRDRRYVVDRGVVTTTGVSASVPISLALVEAIAGREVAAPLAQQLGVADWSEAHDSDAFQFGDEAAWTVVGNTLPEWNKQLFGVPVEDGVDEVSLAFVADAFSRTYRSHAVAVSPAGSVQTLGGLRLRAQTTVPSHLLAPARSEAPAAVVDDALEDISRRYGEGTARFVALQLEYRWPR